MGIKVLYDDDADGFGAAYAARLKFGDNAQYIPVHRGEEPPDFKKEDEVYVLDFNFSKKVMDGIASMVAHLCLLDHHKSASEELSGASYSHFDLTHSAAVIAWHYFLPDQPLPAFYGYIEDHDLGKDALIQTHEIHMAVEMWPRDFAVWKTISQVKIPRDTLAEFKALGVLAQQGEICCRYAHQRAQDMAEQERMAVIDCASKEIRFSQPQPDGDGIYNLPVVNATTQHSHVCKVLLDRHPEYKLAGFYQDLGSGRRQWGLRSTPDGPDVSEIAKTFGGGGHPHAAGFQTYRDADDSAAPLNKLAALGA